MLSLFLGTHSRLVGLGGIDRSMAVLREALAGSGEKAMQRLQCTCGAAATACAYWGAVASRLQRHPAGDRKAEYELALATFAEVFGEDAWPVDSSKHVEPLDDLCGGKGWDVRVAFLVKDVRALTASFIDQARRNKGNTRPATLLAIEYFLRWRRENGKIDDCVARNSVPALHLGYEEVCLAPEIIMHAVSDFLGVPKEAGSTNFQQSNSHLIIGNRMRVQEEKQTLGYDHRWFARRDWLLAAMLLPGVLRYNSRVVYSNGCDAMWTS